ncbi:creatininase family protein [Hyphomicrobium sp. ghe19]|uniref:creatininase family protein n=1 Tax=Hyphomicrobium sp. ghe19 TaxID=2682968 RepID=UPI00136772C1|nr:Creatinine amidohydrolase [Hyphomicrobium sp. ghe19]
MNWAERTWTELPGDLANASHAAILPVGATEQHGPHLGTGMDYVLADRLCQKVAERTSVPMLPVLPYGCSIGHSRRWPGTIALQPITLINIVKEIGDWAYHSGVLRLFIVNSHVTNAAPLRCALEMLRAEHDDMMIALINTATISDRVRAAHFADGDDWHANAAETSLMLAAAPEIARPDLIASSDDPDRTDGLVFSHPVNRTSLNGVTGKPSLANVEQGRELFTWMVEDLAAIIERGKSERPPIDASYFGCPARS